MCFQPKDTGGAWHTPEGKFLRAFCRGGVHSDPGPHRKPVYSRTIPHAGQKMTFRPLCKVEGKARGAP